MFNTQKNIGQCTIRPMFHCDDLFYEIFFIENVVKKYNVHL